MYNFLMSKFKSILFTGASSGIGKEFIKKLAASDVLLALNVRNILKLEAIAKTRRNNGDSVISTVIDAFAQNDVKDWILSLDNSQKFNLLIANACISGNTSGKRNKEKEKRYMIETNIFNIFSTIETIVPRMIEQGYGTIGVVSSLACFWGLNSAQL